MNSNVDFVITWVDGSDLKWINKKKGYDSNINDEWQEGNANIRYRDYDTLRFLLRSIAKYASWVNKIFIITDEQIPKWINLKNPKITIIDHKDIIPEEYRPTFNSNVIEFCIDNIPKLSNNFVVFNDDFIINSPVERTDFFINQKPKDCRLYYPFYPTEDFDNIVFNNVKLLNQKFEFWPENKKGIISWKYGKNNVRNVLQMLNHHISGYLDPHTAISFNLECFRKAKILWQKEIQNTLKHKIRTTADLSIWLIRYYQLETGYFATRNSNFSHFYTLDDYNNAVNDLEREQHSIICLNDVETANFKQESQYLTKALRKKFKKKCEFEI